MVSLGTLEGPIMFRKRDRPSQRPVRRTREYLLRVDSPSLSPIQSDDWILTGDGSLDHITTRREAFYLTCGCSREHELGGQCLCGGSVCRAHFRTCQSCGSGTCPKHSRLIQEEDTAVLLCTDCRDWEAPLRGIKSVLRILGGGSS